MQNTQNLEIFFPTSQNEEICFPIVKHVIFQKVIAYRLDYARLGVGVAEDAIAAFVVAPVELDVPVTFTGAVDFTASFPEELDKAARAFPEELVDTAGVFPVEADDAAGAFSVKGDDPAGAFPAEAGNAAGTLPPETGNAAKALPPETSDAPEAFPEEADAVVSTLAFPVELKAGPEVTPSVIIAINTPLIQS